MEGARAALENPPAIGEAQIELTYQGEQIWVSEKIDFQPKDEGEDRVNLEIDPRQLAKLRRWAQVWQKIKGEWKRTKSQKHVCNWLEKMHPEYAYERKTISKIIKMGDRGELDRYT